MPLPIPPSALLDALDTGLAVLGEDARIQHANPALVGLCGRENLKGMSLADALGVPLRWEGGAATVTAIRMSGERWEAHLTRRTLHGLSLVSVRCGPSAAALATLARDLAHDINNQLHVIATLSGALSATAIPGSSAWEDAREISATVKSTHQKVIRLQRCARSVPIPIEPRATATATIAANILLMDRNIHIGEVTAGMLERSGYQTTVLSNPDTALDLFETGMMSWDLVILSMKRQIDGIEVARAFHSAFHNEQSDLRVVLCVSEAGQPEPEACQAAGITAVIQKPFSHATLLAAVIAALTE
ncbi:MAG: CheY-like chemotaxis protein [Myxococcota bacterium]|jgi:CheY-like chemotaxis protein